MLRSTSILRNFSIKATDDLLGKVKDFLFDDKAWVVRYMVADTGTWLPGRKVLIPPRELGPPDWQKDVVPVDLTREQIRKSPGMSEDEPISRRRELELHLYYGWTPYWTGMEQAHLLAAAERVREEAARDADPNLRSLAEVTGYHIAARDGEIGHLDDLIVDDETWSFRYAVVDTKNWWPGKKVLVSPQWIEKISWNDKQVTIDLSRDQIKSSPPYDPTAPVNRQYEERLYDYYGRPRYWT